MNLNEIFYYLAIRNFFYYFYIQLLQHLRGYNYIINVGIILIINIYAIFFSDDIFLVFEHLYYTYVIPNISS